MLTTKHELKQAFEAFDAEREEPHADGFHEVAEAAYYSICPILRHVRYTAYERGR